MSSRFNFIGAALFFVASSSAHAVTFDFETAGEFGANFRNLNGQVVTQTSNGAANDFISAGTGTGRSFVFDTTPADGVLKNTFTVSTSSSLVVSADVNFTGTGNSFGIHIINPLNETQGYLALFNVDFSGAQDQIRFSSGANPTTTAAGTLVNGSFANNADVGVSTNLFSNISLVYTVNALNEPVFALTAGNTTSTLTFAGISAFPTFEVGFRSFAASGVNQIDNINININLVNSIPEPASMGLLGMSMAALLGRRRVRA